MSKTIVANVLSQRMANYVWRYSYERVFPFAPQDFSVGALLPAILYMLRWGHRRGSGQFEKIFANGSSQRPTIASVARRLGKSSQFNGFDSDLTQAMLGDLLLAHVLENRGRQEGRDKPVQRIFPTHYFASWVDLPRAIANLRGIPEMIVALLTDQPDGENIEPGRQDLRYPIGCRIEENRILTLFAPGTSVSGKYRTTLTSDRFNEEATVGLDQLVTIRLAQACGSAPEKATGKGNPAPITNQRPIATRATKIFQEDLSVFLRAYGTTIPRLSLIPMLEACIGVNLTSIFLSSLQMLEIWKERGRLPDQVKQVTSPVFVDCSVSTDHRLRQLAEQSMEQCRRRVSNLAQTLMYMRLLDYSVRYKSEIPSNQFPTQSPVATEWIDLLGDIALGNHHASQDVHKFLRSMSRELADALREDDAGNSAIDILSSEAAGDSRGWSLAEALVVLMGDNVVKALLGFLTSCLMLDEPNGLGRRRRIRLSSNAARRRTADTSSIALSNTAIEFLVHRHLRRQGKGYKPDVLSLPAFIGMLRDRYGFYIDEAPPDVPVPGELLARNRQMLERRLRDLGLLVGVNDAETMKHLKQRFPATGDEVSG
jgi:hypothetical protein